MVLVKATSLSSLEIEGQPGVRLDLSSVGAPIIEEGEPMQDESNYTKNLTRSVVSGLQQFGLFPRASQPRITLYLTMKEYEAIGKPQINDLIDVTFESSKIMLKTVSKPMA